MTMQEGFSPNPYIKQAQMDVIDTLRKVYGSNTYCRAVHDVDQQDYGEVYFEIPMSIKTQAVYPNFDPDIEPALTLIDYGATLHLTANGELVTFGFSLDTYQRDGIPPIQLELASVADIHLLWDIYTMDRVESVLKGIVMHLPQAYGEAVEKADQHVHFVQEAYRLFPHLNNGRWVLSSIDEKYYNTGNEVELYFYQGKTSYNSDVSLCLMYHKDGTWGFYCTVEGYDFTPHNKHILGDVINHFDLIAPKLLAARNTNRED